MNVPPIERPFGQNVVQPFLRWQQWSQSKRVATPEELARSVLYLASDDARFVTGTAMLVDGGVSIMRGSIGFTLSLLGNSPASTSDKKRRNPGPN